MRAELTRVGAKVRRLRATLAAADGTPLVQACAIALRTAPMLSESVGHGDLAPAPSEAAAPFEFVYSFLIQQKPQVTLPRSQFLNEMGVPSVNRVTGLTAGEAQAIMMDVNSL